LLQLSRYVEQVEHWPEAGRHILAQFDDDRFVVYQAYGPNIAEFALEHQRFGGEFSFQRMTWIKPNFLWMMYRSGWATKTGQERVLAVILKRQFFDQVLSQAVHTTFEPELYASPEDHRQALEESPVRLQWDPDHDPDGRPVARRAIQLGIKGEIVRQYASEAIKGIEDMTELVSAQRAIVERRDWSLLTIPSEAMYRPDDAKIAERIRLDDR